MISGKEIRENAVEKYMIASDLLLDLGPLKVQASQARDNFPPQTHECINNAYNKMLKIIKENEWAMKQPE